MSDGQYQRSKCNVQYPRADVPMSTVAPASPRPSARPPPPLSALSDFRRCPRCPPLSAAPRPNPVSVSRKAPGYACRTDGQLTGGCCSDTRNSCMHALHGGQVSDSGSAGGRRQLREVTCPESHVMKRASREAPPVTDRERDGERIAKHYGVTAHVRYEMSLSRSLCVWRCQDIFLDSDYLLQ